MKLTLSMTRRNTILFFKEKGLFFTSLITPLILLLLYATFLGGIYYDSFVDNVPGLSEELANAAVGGQLISSILAVSCVTVSFCSNMLMVQDKANGSIKDLTIAPIKRSSLALGYYAATLISTLVICLVATVVCLIYVAFVGWYLSFTDVLVLLGSVILTVTFGTALSSVINFFLSNQGQISAVGSIVSSCYGFLCGAYMPISQFGSGLQKLLSFLPGTYATSILRNASLGGVIAEMESQGIPQEAIEAMKIATDCNVFFGGEVVSLPVMYAILASSTALLIGIYVLLNVLKSKKIIKIK